MSELISLSDGRSMFLYRDDVIPYATQGEILKVHDRDDPWEKPYIMKSVMKKKRKWFGQAGTGPYREALEFVLCTRGPVPTPPAASPPKHPPSNTSPPIAIQEEKQDVKQDVMQEGKREGTPKVTGSFTIPGQVHLVGGTQYAEQEDKDATKDVTKDATKQLVAEYDKYLLRAIAYADEGRYYRLLFPLARYGDGIDIVQFVDIPPDRVHRTPDRVHALTKGWIRKHGRLSREQTLDVYARDVTMMLHLAYGLFMLHTHGYVHHDVKLANLFAYTNPDHDPAFTEDTVSAKCFAAHGSQLRFVLGDMGLATKQGTNIGYRGTMDTMAPECFADRADILSHPAMDVWGLGVIMHILCTGQHPLSLMTCNLYGMGHDTAVRYMQASRGRPTLYEADTSCMLPCYTPLYALSKRLLALDPASRPCILDVIRAIEVFDV